MITDNIIITCKNMPYGHFLPGLLCLLASLMY